MVVKRAAAAAGLDPARFSGHSLAAILGEVGCAAYARARTDDSAGLASLNGPPWFGEGGAPVGRRSAGRFPPKSRFVTLRNQSHIERGK